MPMTSSNNLITIHTFKEQEYLIRLEITANCMEIVISDKQIGEEWHCCYDHNYIETLTSKTGNFKTFQVFTKMLKSGLMKISRATTLNLLTYEELHLFHKTIKPYFPNTNDTENENTRYLILIYTTEFDQIYYPLTMDYRGSPNVKSLISTIRRLERDLTKTREDFAAYKIKHKTIKVDTNVEEIKEMKKRIQHLTAENIQLTNENRQRGCPNKTRAELVKTTSLERALLKLENSVISERKSHQKYVEKMQMEKKIMQKEIETLKKQVATLKTNNSKKSSGISSLSGCQSYPPLNSKQPNIHQKKTSRASSKQSRTSSGCESLKSRTSSNSTGRKPLKPRSKTISTVSSQSNASSRARSEKIKVKLQASENDYNVLERRIKELQKRLLSK